MSNPASVTAYAELRVYDDAGTTLRAVLPMVKGLRWVDELAGDGSASYTASLVADALTADGDLLESGIAKVAVPLAAGAAPTEVFAWRLAPTSGTLLGVGEDGDRWAGGTLPGLRSILRDAVVYPEGGVLALRSADLRHFGWMSAESTHWYSAGDWAAVYGVRSDAANLLTGWPDPASQLIAADAVEETDPGGQVVLFRSTPLVLAAAARVRVHITGDDLVKMYVDSEEVGSNGVPWGFSTVDLDLGAGSHQLAAEVVNLSGGGYNPLYLNVSVTTLDAAGTPGAVVARTDTTWTCHVVSGTRPGWSAGAILAKLVEEAQDRGVDSLAPVTLGFDGGEDTDTQPWPDRQERSFRVCTTDLGSALGELEEVALEARLTPAGVLNAYIEQGQDLTQGDAPVMLRPGWNLLNLSYQGFPVRVTRALVRTEAGWTESADTSAESSFGRREGGVYAQSASTVAQGGQVGAAVVDGMSTPRRIYTAEVAGVPGCVPYAAFDVGDVIWCPDRSGAQTTMRVLSIAGEAPQDGGPVAWTLELEPVVLSVPE